jgi:hypothetical protein
MQRQRDKTEKKTDRDRGIERAATQRQTEIEEEKQRLSPGLYVVIICSPVSLLSLFLSCSGQTHFTIGLGGRGGGAGAASSECEDCSARAGEAEGPRGRGGKGGGGPEARYSSDTGGGGGDTEGGAPLRGGELRMREPEFASGDVETDVFGGLETGLPSWGSGE